MAENRIRVVIDGDASDLERELRSAGGAVTTFGRQVSGSSRGVSAFNAVADQQVRNLQQIGRYAMYAGQGVAVAGGALALWAGKQGIQFNATMETNRMALSQFLGSTKEADRFLKQLFETAKKGPFEFAGITDAARKLLAFDFSKGEATETLNAISDSVAALGGSADLIDRVVIAMGQIQAKGRVQGDELLQLAEAGIPAYQILQEKLHLTADEVKNIGNAGITADEAIGALVSGMEDRFGGAARRQAKTFSGQMSTLQDNFDQLMGAMTKGLFEEMKDWLPVVNQTAEDIAAIWNRKDITPEQKFKESRKVAERELGPLVDEIGRMVKRADLPEKFGDALSAALPIAAEGAGQLGVQIAKGTVDGFLASDVWGKLLIGGWLFSKMGGFAAIRAAGTKAGAEAAEGAAEGAAARGGFLNGAAGGLASVGLGVAAVVQLQQIQDAFKLFNGLSGDVWEQLDQVEGKAGTVQAKMAGMFDGLKDDLGPLGTVGAVGSGLSDLLGLDGLDDQAENAARLRTILEEINTVGEARASQLRTEGRELLSNLDLTKQGYDAARKILNLKPQAAGEVQGGIDRLAAGQITRMQDIRKLMRQNSIAAARAFGEGTPAWRSAAARNINAAVEAIRQGMRDGVIETRRGKREIRQLLAKRDLLTGADPVGLAQGFRKSWANAGKINQTSIHRIIGQLDQMPKGARNKAAQMLLQMARQMEKDRKLPEGSMSKLRSAIVSNLDVAVKQGSDRIKKLQGVASDGAKGWSGAFERFADGVDDGMSKASRSLDRGQRDTDRAMDRMERRAKGLTAGVGGSFKHLPSPVAAGISSTVAKVNAGLQAVGSDELIELAFASGGMMRVPGTGTADSVPLVGSGIKAVVAPGEDLAVFNRHQRPMVDAALQNTYGVSGLGGFFSKYDRPHYMARGGMAGDDFNLPKATLTGTPDTAREVGQKGLDEFHKYALKYYKAHAIPPGAVDFDGKKIAGWIAPILKWARSAGWGGSVTSGLRTYAEQAALYAARASNPNPVAPPGQSNHEGTVYPRGAVDVSDYTGLNALVDSPEGPFPGKLKWYGMGDPPHFSGTGHARGGFIREVLRGIRFMAEGGLVAHPYFNKATKKGNINGVWPSADLAKDPNAWFALPTLPGYVVGALAEAAGRHYGVDVPGRAMMQMVMHEGGTTAGGKPGSQGTDPGGATKGYGMWASTTNVGNNKMIKALGGFRKQNNPVLNAAAMAQIYKQNGIGAWFGDNYVTDPNADWTGNYKLTNALGGDSYNTALRAALKGEITGSGGDDGEDNATANRLKARKKAIANLRGRAKGTNNPKAREQILWQLVDAYARWGDFDKGKGKEGNRFNEWRHLRDTAYNIAAMKNPNMGAGKLSQLAKWLESHVELTGREKENAGLERRLENTRERGGKKAGKRRKSFFKRLVRDIAGLDPYERNWFRYNTDQIERLEEQISLAEQQHSGAWSEGGSDYTEKEIATEVDLNTRLKERMASRIGKYSSALAAARGYKSIFESKIAQARKDPKQRWKIPAFRRGLKQAEAALSRLRDDRETMIGVTGRGGDFRQVQFRLRELGVMDSTEDQAAAARDSELNTILKEQLIQSQRGFALGQAQYAVFKDFLGGVDSPFLGAFAMGTAGRRVGRTGLAVLHENEVVTPDPKGPYGQNMSTVGSSSAAPRVEITVAGDVAPLLSKVEAIVDGKTAQVVRKVNSELGRERRQLAYAPGR